MIHLHNELEVIKTVSANSYKVYRYLTLSSDSHGVCWNMSRERIQEGTGISYNTVYKCITELKDHGLIEYNGNKQFAKVLPLIG